MKCSLIELNVVAFILKPKQIIQMLYMENVSLV